MHKNSLKIMQEFVKGYVPDKELKILDLGSCVVPGQEGLGSYRQFFTNAKWRYTGADIEAGENVEVVITDGYAFPFDDEEFDVVISGQTLEHVEYPWVWFKEMARVLKKGGLCCIIAPAVFFEHKHPIDTFRYYPDGMRALAKWSGLEVLKTERAVDIRDKGKQDTYLVAKKVNMQKGIIYYTHNTLEEPTFSIVQKQILKADLPIVSVSLKPIDFGKNIVLDLQPGVITMFRQILTALEASTSDVIFFCEHDVLYHPTHFDFAPPRDDVFYYNINVWRWLFPEDLAVAYGGAKSVSGLCANRQFLLNHYRLRMKIIEENGFENSRNPRWSRVMGFEPGKEKRRGGISDDPCETWGSSYPNVDIRHKGVMTQTKRSLADFRRPPDPATWKEVTLDKIDGWDLKELFKLGI